MAESIRGARPLLNGEMAAMALREAVERHHLAGALALRVGSLAGYLAEHPAATAFNLAEARAAVDSTPRSADVFNEFTSKFNTVAEGLGLDVKLVVDSGRGDASRRRCWVEGAHPLDAALASFSDQQMLDRGAIPTVAPRARELNAEGLPVVEVRVHWPRPAMNTPSEHLEVWARELGRLLQGTGRWEARVRAVECVAGEELGESVARQVAEADLLLLWVDRETDLAEVQKLDADHAVLVHVPTEPLTTHKAEALRELSLVLSADPIDVTLAPPAVLGDRLVKALDAVVDGLDVIDIFNPVLMEALREIEGDKGQVTAKATRQGFTGGGPGAAKGEVLSEMLETWLGDKNGAPYFVLLGDYGMGKTTAVQLLHHQLSARRAAGEQARQSVYLDLRHMSVVDGLAPTLAGLIDEVIAGTPLTKPCPVRSQHVLDSVRLRDGLLIVDGLDEVLVHLSTTEVNRMFAQLWTILPRAQSERGDGRVIFTCRTHYFPSQQVLADNFLGLGRNEARVSLFEVAELLPWDEGQIRQFLAQARRASAALCLGGDADGLLVDGSINEERLAEMVAADEAALASIHDLAELARRPVHLAFLAEDLAQLAEGKVVRAADIYRRAVERTWTRDQGKHAIPPRIKESILGHLAAHLHRSGARRIDSDQLGRWLNTLAIPGGAEFDAVYAAWLTDPAAAAERPPGDLREVFLADLRTATLLVRGDERGFGFAHSSVQEYFLARYLAEGLLEGEPDRWRLPTPSQETVGFLTDLMSALAERGEADPALQTLRLIRGAYQPQVSELTLRYAVAAVRVGAPTPPLAHWRLEGANLRGLRVLGPEDGPLLNAEGMHLAGADLRDSRWQRVRLDGVDLDRTRLQRARFLDCALRRSSVVDAQLAGAWIRGSSLADTDLAAAHQHRTHVLACEPAQMNVRACGSVVGVELGNGHTGPVLGVALPGDGNRLAAAGSDGTARLWDAATGEQLLTLAGHTGPVLGVALSGDGTRLVTASSDGTARLWDAATGEQLLTLAGHTGPVLGVALSGDGTRLVTASSDGMARLWDVMTGEQLLTLAGHTAAVRGVALSGDGTRLVTASWDGTARLWDVMTGEQLLTLAGHTAAVEGVALSGDGTRLATASEDGTARLWDPATGEQLVTFSGHTGPVWGVAFSCDGTRLATASSDGTARLWDPATGEQLLTFSGHTGTVRGVAFSGDGTRLATASSDGTARLWDPDTGEQLLTVSGHTGTVWGVAFSGDGTRVATASLDGTARLWDAATGEQLLTFSGHTGTVRGVAFSGDGTRVATASLDGTARLWDAATGEQLLTFSGHTGPVWGVAFSGDGTRLATASLDGTARLWDAATGEQLLTFSGHTGTVRGVAFSGDGARLATASNDGTARLWDSAAGEQFVTFTGHTGSVWGVAFSGDGTRVATASLDGTARLWDSATGEQLLTFSGHTGTVLGVALSGDGTRVATAGGDGTARLWDSATGEQLLTLTGHTGTVLGVALSGDGTRVATASDDGTARLWDLATGRAVLTTGQWRGGGWASWDAHGVTACTEDAWERLLALIEDSQTGRREFWPVEYAGPLPEPRLAST